MKKILPIVLLIVFASALFLAATALAGGAPSPGASGPKPPLKIGDQTKDPVCGMNITVGPNTEQLEYQGGTYYFCSADCKTKFEKNPEKYLPKPKK